MENLLLSCIESRVENNRSFYGRFQLGPFYQGQGLTVANAFRRTLLSELKGLAITSVKIQGASHEYSSLPGIRDSVVSILLNLKQIIFISDCDFKEPQIGYLDIQGPAVVKSSDLKLPIFIQCVDPEQYIATLSHDGILKMKFVISQGKNYVIQTPLNIKKEIFNQSLSFPKNSLSEISLVNESEKGKSFFSTSSTIISKFNLLKNTKINSQNNFSKKIKNQLIFSPNQKIDSNFNLKGKQFSSSFFQNSTIPFIDENNLLLFSKLPYRFRNINKKILNFQNTKDTVKTISFEKKKNYPYQTNEKEFFKNFPSKSKYFKSFQKTAEIKSSSLDFSKIEKNTTILPIDSVFMPVNKVNFLLENDDESLDLRNLKFFESEKKKERIILEIWTDGSIHPRQAIHEAAKSLICLFFPFQETQLLKSAFLNSTKLKLKEASKKPNTFNFSLKQKNISFNSNRILTQEEKNRFSIDIGNLDLSLRPYTCLKRANINTVGDLLEYSSDELLLLKNFGKRSLEEVEKTLAQMSLKLRNKNSEEFLFLQKKNNKQKQAI